MKSGLTLILASASPRRQELLQQIGVKFSVCPVDICEIALPDELPQTYVKRLSEQKAQQGLLVAPESAVVLGADTIVVHQGQVMGKPRDKKQAIEMLLGLSNSIHSVLTAITVLNQQRRETRLVATKVCFNHIKLQEAIDYWNTGEPQDKAGAYAIQGRGAVFVRKIEGSYSAVVGLPLSETRELLDLFQIPWWCEL